MASHSSDGWGIACFDLLLPESGNISFVLCEEERPVGKELTDYSQKPAELPVNLLVGH